MGKPYSHLPLEFGLLAGLAAAGDDEFEDEIALLRVHCFDAEKSSASGSLDSLHLNAMEEILERMKLASL